MDHARPVEILHDSLDALTTLLEDGRGDKARHAVGADGDRLRLLGIRAAGRDENGGQPGVRLTK
jgi:hypothetical protein